MIAVEVPYKTANGLAPDVRANVVHLLNQLLCDGIDLQLQAKQAHWNVKGPHFISLHKLFDDVYAAVEGYVDLLAERVVQLGGIARGTAHVVAETSELSEYPRAIASGADHTHAIAVALAEFGGHMRRATGQTTDWADANTADICTEVSRGLDKWLWFVEAHGQSRDKAPAFTLQAN
jgi:starvation-inducible DNA-binding protein